MRKQVLVMMSIAALGLPGCHRSGPPTTEVVDAVSVDADGKPAHGYRETPYSGNIAEVFGCAASPAAVSAGIYACGPSAAGADVCWPSTEDTLLCVDTPWDKRLHRVRISDTLPQVEPVADPQPFGLLLDDGSRCRLRNGGSWGGRDDGYYGAYWCESSKLTVLAPADADGIDRSARLWTVKVGELGEPGQHFPPPQTRSVRTAWFAGHGGA